MPLSLSRKEGQDFYVGEARVVVEKILEGGGYTLRLEDGTVHEVVGDRAVEIAEDVMISAGIEQGPRVIMVVIDAPEDVLVLRGELKRRSGD